MSAMAMALMSEEGAYALDDMLSNYGDAFIWEKLKDEAKFAIAEFLPDIPRWAEMDYCNPDKFLDKNNFGKVPKEKLFAR
jgi:hypothetical protein